MPASKNPVRKRQNTSAPKEEAEALAATVQAALPNAHSRKTRCGGKRSASASSANTSAPEMKPNCTADVNVPTEAAGQPKSRCRSGITALTANQGEVPRNCASTRMGRTRRGAEGDCIGATVHLASAEPKVGTRLAAAVQISALSVFGNRNLTLMAFPVGCPLPSEPDLHRWSVR